MGVLVAVGEEASQIARACAHVSFEGALWALWSTVPQSL